MRQFVFTIYHCPAFCAFEVSWVLVTSCIGDCSSCYDTTIFSFSYSFLSQLYKFWKSRALNVIMFIIITSHKFLWIRNRKSMIIQSPVNVFKDLKTVRNTWKKYHILQILVLQQVMLDLFCYNKKHSSTLSLTTYKY